MGKHMPPLSPVQKNAWMCPLRYFHYSSYCSTALEVCRCLSARDDSLPPPADRLSPARVDCVCLLPARHRRDADIIHDKRSSAGALLPSFPESSASPFREALRPSRTPHSRRTDVRRRISSPRTPSTKAPQPAAGPGCSCRTCAASGRSGAPSRRSLFTSASTTGT